MKVKVLCLTLLLSVILFAGCTKDNDDNTATPSPTTAATTDTNTADTNTTDTTDTDNTANQTTDAVTTASIVNKEDAFLKAISNQGTWIIAILQDMTIDQDLVLDGDFKNSSDEVQRKLAFYSQDEDRNITARYTLTAPKLTINSPKASIQHGTFKGDVYVNAEDFELVDATVDGNVYFMTEDAQKSFVMDDTSKVTGKQELQK